MSGDRGKTAWNTGEVLRFGFGFALMLHRRKIKGLPAVESALFFPYLLNVSIVSIVWMFLFDPDVGIVNYYLRRVGLAPPTFLNDPVFFIFAWNQVFWSFIALQKSQMLTIPIGMKTVTTADDIRYTTLMALSFLASLPALLVFLALRRHVIAGISMASVRR